MLLRERFLCVVGAKTIRECIYIVFLWNMHDLLAEYRLIKGRVRRKYLRALSVRPRSHCHCCCSLYTDACVEIHKNEIYQVYLIWFAQGKRILSILTYSTIVFVKTRLLLTPIRLLGVFQIRFDFWKVENSGITIQNNSEFDWAWNANAMSFSSISLYVAILSQH